MAFSMVEDADDAKNAVNQVFTQMWKGKPNMSEDCVRGYLLPATRNQCLHILRQRQLQRQMEEELLRATEASNNEEREELLRELQLWLNCREPQYPDKMGSEYGLGLTRFDGNACTTYNHNNSPLPGDCFWDVQVDADNRKWLAAAGDLDVVGLTCFDGTEWTIYNSDNSGIVLNEVTKITLDPLHDLIWLTHHPGLGLSVARLNSHDTAVQSIAAPIFAPTTYDLSGRQIANPTKGIYIKQGKKFVKESGYIIYQ